MELLDIYTTGDDSALREIPTDVKLSLAARLIDLAFQDIRKSRDIMFAQQPSATQSHSIGGY